MCQCGDCGSGVSGMIVKRKVREKGYECTKYREYGAKVCVCHEIKEKDILMHLKEFLKITKEIYMDDIEKIKISVDNKNKNADKEKMKNEFRILNEEYKILVSHKIRDITSTLDPVQRNIIETTYAQLEKEKTQKISNLKYLIEKNEKDLAQEKIEKAKTAIEYFDEVISCEEPNKLILRLLIDKIYIYHDRTVKFDLKPNIIKLIGEE